MQILRSRIALLAVLLTALLSLGGCAVTRAIGDAIASAYDNTIAYFNVYYNADRLFGEAEAEFLAAEQSARARSPLAPPTPVAVPAGARQKLTTVIDKCSKILSLHTESSLVDDALLLVGKSYYYLGEYVKAERKFAELLLQFPDGPTALEGQLWLLQVLERQGKLGEAMVTGEDLLAKAQERGEDRTAGRAAAALGAVSRADGNPDRALAYYRSARENLGGEERVDVAVKMAEIRREQGDLAGARESYSEALRMTSDAASRFVAGVQLVRILRDLGQHEDALRLADELAEDYLLIPYVKELRLERARTLAAQGRFAEAEAAYTDIDTTSSRTEVGARAAFELGGLLERRLADYPRARAAYGRALLANVVDIAPTAKARESALGRYLALSEARARIDSVLAVDETPRAPLPDSVDVQPPVVARDSLRAVRLQTVFQIAEIFASELEVPDSALVWYRVIIESDTNLNRRSRALFVAAEILSDRSTADQEQSRAYYEQILEENPRSPFAAVAAERLGRQRDALAADPAERQYAQAEAELEGGKVKEALQTFSSIFRNHPESPLAAKSLYTAGWIYEHRLQQADSALAQYRQLVDLYASSRYAQAVRQRIGPASESVPADTTSLPAVQAPDDTDRPRGERGTLRERALPPGRAKTDERKD